MEESEYCANCKRNISLANYATHSAFCERKIKLCDGCNEPVPRNQLDEHIQEYHAFVACSQCEEVLEKWQLQKHMEEECSKRKIVCSICERDFPLDEMKDHSEFCGSRTEKCILCKKFIMLKEMEHHMKLHVHEQKLHTKGNVDVEIKQNSINECISEADLTPDDSTKLPHIGTRCKQIQDQGNFKNNDKYLYSASAASENSEKVYSKLYGDCIICKRKIPWVDMNTHVPNCASAAGRCSRCGERVPDGDIKNHVMKTCKMLSKTGTSPPSESPLKAESYNNVLFRQKNIAPDNDLAAEYQAKFLPKCPYCKECFPDEILVEHIRLCPHNRYECPLCLKIMPHNDKSKHENFECSVLIDANAADSGVTTSYSNAAKKTSNRNDIHSRSTGAYQVIKNMFKLCQFCHNEILRESEKFHLSICPAIHDKNYHVSQSINPSFHSKGAVPKYDIPSKKGPEMDKCPHCFTVYNADILPFHKTECINIARPCPACDEMVPRKDAEKHIEDFHSGKGRGKKKFGKQSHSVKEEHSKLNFIQKWWYGADKHNVKKNRDETYFQPPYFKEYYDENALIPCEFCNVPFPIEEIVIHQTGCKPELVSYARKKAEPEQEERETSRSYLNATSRVQLSEKNVALRSLQNEFFKPPVLDENFQNSKPQKNDCIRRHELNVQPGEYLKTHQVETEELPFTVSKQHNNDKNILSENVDIEKFFKENLNEEAMDTSEIQSCWNHSEKNLFPNENIHTEDKIKLPQDLKHNEIHLEEKYIKSVNQDKSSYISDDGDDDEMSSFVNFINRSDNMHNNNESHEEIEKTAHDSIDVRLASMKLSCSCEEVHNLSNCTEFREFETSKSQNENEVINNCCTNDEVLSKPDIEDQKVLLENSVNKMPAFWKSHD